MYSAQDLKSQFACTWTENSKAYRTPTSTYWTPTSTYQHVDKASPSLFAPSRISPSQWTTHVQTDRHLEAVESDDYDLSLTQKVTKVNCAYLEQLCVLFYRSRIIEASGLPSSVRASKL